MDGRTKNSPDLSVRIVKTLMWFLIKKRKKYLKYTITESTICNFAFRFLTVESKESKEQSMLSLSKNCTVGQSRLSIYPRKI